MTRALVALLLSAIGPAAADFNAIPGGIARVALPVTADAAPTVTYQNRRVWVQRGAQGWEALVGLPLEAVSGEHRIEVEDAAGARSVTFAVAPHEYPLQELTIPDERMVKLSPADLARAERERVALARTLEAWGEAQAAAAALHWPLSGRISGDFGLRRRINGEPRKSHSGLDIAAPEGTAVVAAADGVVAEIADHFFSGNVVVLDHGRGLKTLYAHLQRVDVQPGQGIAAGAPLGTVGKTGRATGPHLHFGAVLNGHSINPALLLPPP